MRPSNYHFGNFLLELNFLDNLNQNPRFFFGFCGISPSQKSALPIDFRSIARAFPIRNTSCGMLRYGQGAEFKHRPPTFTSFVNILFICILPVAITNFILCVPCLETLTLMLNPLLANWPMEPARIPGVCSVTQMKVFDFPLMGH